MCWCSRWDLDAEALQAKIGTLSLEAQEKLDKDTAKKEAKAEAKADAALKKKMVRSASYRFCHATDCICCRHHKYGSFVSRHGRTLTDFHSGHDQADRAEQAQTRNRGPRARGVRYGRNLLTPHAQTNSEMAYAQMST